MKRVFLISVIYLLFVAVGSAQTDTTFAFYKRANDSEPRLPAYKDNDEMLQLKLSQLNLINTNRKKYNAAPVQLDILASRVANKMCRETAENNYGGHWNLAGETPYMRWAFAGGKDHVSENAAIRSLPRGRLNTATELAAAMRELHGGFMAERAPHDGHKQNCINKTHNFVGLGCFSSGTQLSYYEEYIDRYFEFENVPAAVKAGTRFTIGVRTRNEQYLFCLIAFYDKFPEPMKAAAIARRDHYNDFGSRQALVMYPWQLAAMRTNDLYEIELKFDKPGLYYIHIYQSDREVKTEQSFDIKGKTEGSGIVIRVE